MNPVTANSTAHWHLHKYRFTYDGTGKDSPFDSELGRRIRGSRPDAIAHTEAEVMDWWLAQYDEELERVAQSRRSAVLDSRDRDAKPVLELRPGMSRSGFFHLSDHVVILLDAIGHTTETCRQHQRQTV